jgi:Zn-dependent protease
LPVLLDEPPRSQGDLNFSLLGIPVRIHPLFWVAALILGYNSGGARELLLWVVAFLLSILVHELGHAATMWLYGLHPSITLYGMGGLTSANFAAPIGGARRRLRPLDQIAISLAGPLAGFALAAAICGVIVLAKHHPPLEAGGPLGFYVAPSEIIGSPLLTWLICQILHVSIIWGIINLMPVHPLDGGQIARELLMVISPGDGLRLSLILSTAAGAALAIVGWTQLHSVFAAVLFGYLAFQSFAMLQAYSGRRGPW